MRTLATFGEAPRLLDKSLAPLLAVTAQSVVDDRIRLARRTYLIHFHFFSFKLFVILEESSQHDQAVWWHLRGFAVGVEFRVFGSDSNDFMIFFAAVEHGHQADGSRVNDGQRNYAFLAENQNIERVIVFGQGLGNEAVV